MISEKSSCPCLIRLLYLHSVKPGTKKYIILIAVINTKSRSLQPTSYAKGGVTAFLNHYTSHAAPIINKILTPPSNGTGVIGPGCRRRITGV